MSSKNENPYYRIENIIDHLKITANGLAKAIGLPRTQNLYDIRDGKIKKISFDLADKIITVFPQFNRDWIISGDGKMINTVDFVNEPIVEYQSSFDYKKLAEERLQTIDRLDKFIKRLEKDIELLEAENNSLKKENRRMLSLQNVSKI